ncbi:hypothetical protein, partial [Aquiflexum sp.]|uniref:hypothetical protein n=1 Tax=Aquiflexum sp. TaxID=1872584 RepID=UPI003593EFFC
FTDLNMNRVQEDSVANVNRIFLGHLTLINNMDMDDEEAGPSAEEVDKNSPAFDFPEFSLGDNLPELLDKIYIDEINLENIHYRQQDIMDVSGITFVTRDMRIDKTPAFADNRFLHADKFSISIDSLDYLDKDQQLMVGLDKFRIDMEDGTGSLSLNTLIARHAEKNNGELYADAKINGFNISGINTRNLPEKSFSIDSISIEYPKFIVVMPEVSDEGGAKNPLDLYPAIADFLDKLQIDKIALIEADIQVSGLEGTSGTVRIPAAYLQISDLLIAKGTAFSKNRVLHTDDIAVRVENITAPLADGTHRASLDLFRLSTREGLFELNGISYKTDKDVDALLKDSEVEMVFEINSNQLKITKLDYAALIRDQAFYAGTVRLNGLDVAVFGELAFAEKVVEEAAKEAREEMKLDFSAFTLADMLPETFGRVKIGAVEFQEINLNHEDLGKVGGMELAIRNIQIDKDPAFAENRFLHTKSFKFSMDTVSFLEERQMLRVAFKDMALEIENGTGSFGMNKITAKHSENDPGEIYLDAAIEGFHIKGIDTREMTDKKFSIDSIVLSNPKILEDLGDSVEDADEPEPGEREKQKDSDNMDLYPAIADFLDEVQINKIAIVKADISVDGIADRTAHLPAIYLQASDVLIAEGTAFREDRVLHSSDIAVRLERIDFPLPDNVNSVGLELFEMSTGEGYLQADGFVYDYNENFRQLMEGPETNMVMKISNNDFSIKGLDFGLLIQQKGVFADSIIVAEGLNVEVFVDNHYPAEAGEDLPPTIQQLIKEVGMPLYLGSLLVNNAKVVYEELAEDGDEPGRFWLEELNLEVNNLTNIDRKINSDPETNINVNTMLMGDGHFKTCLIIPMNDLSRPVKFTGRIDSLDLTKLNRYTEYTTLFGFESGTIYTLLWDFEAGNEEANGTFGLSYENLNIQLSASDSPEPAGGLYQIGAYLANVLILDEDMSEGKSDPPKTVKFSREKDDEESFIDHYISSIIAGFVEIMGFPLSIIDP